MEKWQNEVHSRKLAWILKMFRFLWVPDTAWKRGSECKPKCCILQIFSHNSVTAFSKDTQKEWDLPRTAHPDRLRNSPRLQPLFRMRPGAVWVIRVTRLLEQDGKRTEGRRRVCLVARIRGGRQERIWFIMASLTVSLFLLVSSFLSSLSLFH